MVTEGYDGLSRALSAFGERNLKTPVAILLTVHVFGMNGQQSFITNKSVYVNTEIMK